MRRRSVELRKKNEEREQKKITKDLTWSLEAQEMEKWWQLEELSRVIIDAPWATWNEKEAEWILRRILGNGIIDWNRYRSNNLKVKSHIR